MHVNPIQTTDSYLTSEKRIGIANRVKLSDNRANTECHQTTKFRVWKFADRERSDPLLVFLLQNLTNRMICADRPHLQRQETIAGSKQGLPKIRLL
mmetsp:Transcript_16453/g.37762  ORF Transcript_16453/g.37762 Transcript_16453/m.37762 type:complete len:96 (+) Transcript_16453:355-642(+)